ncbi:MAG: twin-arginine translocase subunit TatB [Gammaproteobacteria bacterium]|nr:twin-arginine translocase subunit TatB [Gammaproteobacteria bacterium]
MFDIGFSELLMVALVALLVIGPERLPVAARTLGLILGRIKRSLGSIREEVEREIGMDEIRLELRNQDILAKERQLLEETSQSVKEATDYANRMAQDATTRLNQTLQPYSPDKIVKNPDPAVGRLDTATEPAATTTQPDGQQGTSTTAANSNEPAAPGSNPP